ncbi:MAG: hypothetical protein ACWA40_10715 [Planktomarina sp.]
MNIKATALMLCLATPAAAQHNMFGGDHPTEAGQDSFAAISEIVEILRNDPATDWSSVNINALRKHLVDMDLVTTQAIVDTRPTPEGAVFEITGEARVLEAINAMVPAHAPFLMGDTGWTAKAEPLIDGYELTVTGDAEQIQGLGFFGLMAVGGHHQIHHMMMATGQGHH